MRAQKRKSQKREKYIIYKGQSIHTNSPYGYDLKNKVGLFYDPIQGVECFFKSVGKAKAYLDSIQRLLPIKNDNNIPF